MLRQAGVELVVDEEGTAEHVDDAWRLADRNLSGGDFWGVSLAQVTRGADDLGLQWVVVSRNVTWRCFGGHACGGDDGFGWAFAEPGTLRSQLTGVVG